MKKVVGLLVANYIAGGIIMRIHDEKKGLKKVNDKPTLSSVVGNIALNSLVIPVSVIFEVNKCMNKVADFFTKGGNKHA